MNKKLTGIILCGGLSTRMGKDKGLLKKGELFWFQSALNTVSSFVSSTYVSINPGQLEGYSGLHAKEFLIVDSFPVEGPLKGLLSAHTFLPKDDLLVLACDMIDMQKKIIEKLVKNYSETKGSQEAYTFKHDSFFEPLCSIYTSSGLSKIKEQIEKGTFESLAMHAVLKNLHTQSIALTQEEKEFFKNYNTPLH